MLLHLTLACIVTPVPNASSTLNEKNLGMQEAISEFCKEVPVGQSEKMLTAWFSSEPVQVQLTIAQMTSLTCVH